MFAQLLPSKPILTVPSLYGGWPVRGGCVNSKQSSAELCDPIIIMIISPITNSISPP